MDTHVQTRLSIPQTFTHTHTAHTRQTYPGRSGLTQTYASNIQRHSESNTGSRGTDALDRHGPGVHSQMCTNTQSPAHDHGQTHRPQTLHGLLCISGLLPGDSVGFLQAPCASNGLIGITRAACPQGLGGALVGPRVWCLGLSGLPMILDLTVETFQGCVQPGLDFLLQRQGPGGVQSVGRSG